VTSRKRRRHTPDQIIRKLAEGHKQLAAGKELDEVCRHLEIAESTWHPWHAQYGGMKANDAKRLKELELENARLKKLLAEVTFLVPGPSFPRARTMISRGAHSSVGGPSARQWRPRLCTTAFAGWMMSAI
jgi:hypothetical protein